MAVAFRACSSNQATTGTSASVTQPTGAVSGDGVLVALIVRNDTAQTFGAVSGWTLTSQDSNVFNTTSAFKSAVYFRTLDGSETWPISFPFSPGGTIKNAWMAMAFSPGTGGNVVVVDGEATVKVDTTGASTHTANSKTAVAASVASVILNCGRTSAASATAISATPPTSYTEPTNGDRSTSAGTTAALSQLGIEGCYRLAQSGTVTPTATTWSQSTIAANTYHFLLDEITPETSPQLEASGFGAFLGIGNNDTINSVTATVNQWQSSTTLGRPTYQLWNGVSGQIGADITGSSSVSTANTDSPQWTGVTYANLQVIRFRIAAHQGGAVAAVTQSVDWVALTVSYTPAAGGPPATVTSPKVPFSALGDFGSQASFA